MGPLKKILIINLGGIGDMLLSTPAVRALKNTFPKSRISLLAFPRVAELAADLPYIDGVFSLRRGIWGIFRSLNTLLRLRKERFDAGVNMRTMVSGRSAKKIKLLMDFINPGRSAGRNTEGRGYFFDIKTFETDIAKKPELEYDMDMARILGSNAADKKTDFIINDENVKRVDRILCENKVNGKEFLIGIHPGGKPAHRWPLDNFSKIIDLIFETAPGKFVITGDKNELDLAKRLVRMTATKTINLAGKLQIGELGALIKKCSLFITNDTGAMHIAAALEAPMIAIFGPGDIVRYDPRNISKNAVVLYKKIHCSPCNKIRCDSIRCLKSISPEEVMREAMKLLFPQADKDD